MKDKSSLERLMSARQEAFADSDARKRLESFFDEGTFNELGGFIQTEREPVELVCGYGLVKGLPVYAFSQAGAIGERHVYKMKKVYSLALKTGTPIVGFYDSQGLYISQGVKVLDDCAELILAQNNLSGVVPQISVVLGSCVGTNAVMAISADYLIMSQNATFFSTPPTAYTKDEISTAKATAQAGVSHITAEDEVQAMEYARQLIEMHPQNFETMAPELDYELEQLSEEAEEQLLEMAEDIENLDYKKYSEYIFDAQNTIEFMPEFGSGVTAQLRTLDGKVCGVIATNGEALTADDCVKIARLVWIWDSYDIPVITFVNCVGLAPLGAASARDFAKLAQVYAESSTAKIAVIVGKAYGAGYVSLASRGSGSDYTVAWPAAQISTLSPETAVAFMEGGRITETRSRKSLEQEYASVKASAINAAEEGIIDDIINPLDTRRMLKIQLDMLLLKHQERSPKKHSNIPF